MRVYRSEWEWSGVEEYALNGITRPLPHRQLRAGARWALLCLLARLVGGDGS